MLKKDAKVGVKVKHKGYVNIRPGVFDSDSSQPFRNYGIYRGINTDKVYTIENIQGNSLYLEEISGCTFHIDEFVLAHPVKKLISFFD